MVTKILYIISFVKIINFVSDEIQNVSDFLLIKKYIPQYKLYGLCFLGQDKNAVLKTIVNLLFLMPFPITFIKNMNEVNRKKQKISHETKSFVIYDLPFW